LSRQKQWRHPIAQEFTFLNIAKQKKFDKT
jgi:hypothetical protein